MIPEYFSDKQDKYPRRGRQGKARAGQERSAHNEASSRGETPGRKEGPAAFNAHALDLDAQAVIPDRPSIDLNYTDFTRESYEPAPGASRSHPRKKKTVPFELSETPRTQSEFWEGRGTSRRRSGAEGPAGFDGPGNQATEDREQGRRGGQNEERRQGQAAQSQTARQGGKAADGAGAAAGRQSDRRGGPGGGQQRDEAMGRPGGGQRVEAVGRTGGGQRAEAAARPGGGQQRAEAAARPGGGQRVEAPRQSGGRNLRGEADSGRGEQGGQTPQATNGAVIERKTAFAKEQNGDIAKEQSDGLTKERKGGFLFRRQSGEKKVAGGAGGAARPEENQDPGSQSLIRPYWLKK
jgi:hypothetical protein